MTTAAPEPTDASTPGAPNATPATTGPVSTAELTLDEQAALTAGSDLWHTAGVERLGVSAIGVTDGPSGARGTELTGTTSTSMPCGTALAATWNRALIDRVGEVLGIEARARGAAVLLAPTVNLHRHPLGGRNFESYSEDPYLTGEIAVAFIEGVQRRGVACAVKHFVGNDQETDRQEIDVVVDERARRELYFPPFEAAVRRAGVWAVMAAYNRVDGCHCSEHAGLLTGLLRDEWGFDGVVMSDWFATHGAAALAAGLDLEMPGPANFLGHHLTAAVEAGDVAAADVERAAARMLTLLERTAATPGPPATDVEAADVEAAAVARAAATEAIVLLANDGVLPLGAPDTGVAGAGESLAVIGWRADDPAVQGGGSAQVTPPYVITPLRGLQDRAGVGAVTYESGRVAPRSAPLTGRMITSPDAEADAPVRLEYFAAGDLAGRPVRTERAREAMAFALGDPVPGLPGDAFTARVTTVFTPDVTGPWTLSMLAAGAGRLFIDGEPLVTPPTEPASGGPVGLLALQVEAAVDLEAGTRYEVVGEVDAVAADGPVVITGIALEARPPTQPDAIERAVATAGDADVAIVVVGRDDPESEGFDTATMDLPDHQVELIRRIAAVNARTVVVVNTASPVTMDWADDAAATVQLSYLGQEAGAALAAVLFGDADASGRLTATFPRRIEDSPAFANFPGGDGSVRYEEGVFVGYRHYDTHGLEPRWCFGHGLSYTTVAYSDLRVAGGDESDGGPVGGSDIVTVTVDVTNTGDRTGSEVIQLYVRPLDAPVARPDRELKGFEKVTLAPGETATVDLTLDERAFAHWDESAGAWHAAPGAYELLVGSSSRTIHQTATWTRP